MKPYLITALWACIVVIRPTVYAQTPVTPGPQSQAMVEGQPIERRPPEKRDDRPTFPEQTRAPYHATTPFKVTTLIDNFPAPWGLTFLPDGKILFTERLPGSIRILDTKGMVSKPVAGV